MDEESPWRSPSGFFLSEDLDFDLDLSLVKEENMPGEEHSTTGALGLEYNFELAFGLTEIGVESLEMEL